MMCGILRRVSITGANKIIIITIRKIVTGFVTSAVVAAAMNIGGQFSAVAWPGGMTLTAAG